MGRNNYLPSSPLPLSFFFLVTMSTNYIYLNGSIYECLLQKNQVSLSWSTECLLHSLMHFHILYWTYEWMNLLTTIWYMASTMLYISLLVIYPSLSTSYSLKAPECTTAIWSFMIVYLGNWLGEGPHTAKKFEFMYSQQWIARPQYQFPQPCVCERSICSHVRPTYFPMQQNRQTDQRNI